MWKKDKRSSDTISTASFSTHVSAAVSSENTPGVGSNATVDKRLPRVGTCTASNGNFQLARQWITTCVNNHASCTNTRQVLAYPSRLIHVGTDGEDPRLHEVTADDQKLGYLTLSHCWGGQSLISLASASLPDFKRGIPFSSLSKNFQDAVTIVRKLGYEYLWIDSLCIIQNSKEDWKHESELMGDIYRNSVCTIAATASKDGDGGCFRLCSTLRDLPCQLWADEEHEICVDVEEDFVAKRYRKEVNSGPLNARAWVLQERTLSPRILHYSETSVYWDYQEAHCSDTGHPISDDSFLSWGFGTGDIRLFDKETLTSEKNFSDRWQSSVEKYFEMKLTVQSDRLIAVAGIMKYIEEVTGLECTFVLWMKHVIEHLFWRVGDASTRSARQIGARMPSWSSASIESGNIRYFPPHKADMAATFWYPDGETDVGRSSLDLLNSSKANDAVKDMLKEMESSPGLSSTYSSDKIYCASFEGTTNSDRLCVRGKLASSSGTLMILRDDFTNEEEEEILKTIHIEGDEFRYRHLTGVWLDVLTTSLAKDLTYLRVFVQGAQKPSTERYFRWPSDGLPYDPNPPLVAPYALYSSGLVLASTGEEDEYFRVGFFRSVETFAKSPPPHPTGVDPEDALFKDSWLGEEVANRTITLI